jgi:hypothetical protein
MGRVVGGFLAAVITTYVLGAVFISQGNISSVVEMGFEISFAQRLGAMFHDITHMTDIYLPVTTLSLLIALPVAALIIKQVPNLRLLGYTLAGIVALIAVHLIIKALVGFSGSAPTRTVVGLLAQGLAGGMGGLLFHFVTLKKETVS